MNKKERSEKIRGVFKRIINREKRLKFNSRVHRAHRTAEREKKVKI